MPRVLTKPGLASATHAPPLPSLTDASLSKETKVLLMPPIMAAKARSPAAIQSVRFM